MSVFSFLQNEIQGAGNAIQNNVINPVSNTYHAAVSNIGNFVSHNLSPQNIQRAGGQALSDTGQFVKQIFNPVGTIANTQPVQNLLAGNNPVANAVSVAAPVASSIQNKAVSLLPTSTIPGTVNPLKYYLTPENQRQSLIDETRQKTGEFLDASKRGDIVAFGNTGYGQSVAGLSGGLERKVGSEVANGVKSLMPHETPPVPSESTNAAMENLGSQQVLKDKQLPLQDIAKEAVQQKNSLAQQIRTYGTAVNNVVSKLSPTDSQNLAHALEHPTEVAALTAQAENPSLFAKAVETTRQQLANVEAGKMNSSATQMGHVENYFPHSFTSQNPEAAAKALENMGVSQFDAKNFIAGSSKQRVFPDVRTAQSILDENGKPIFEQNPNSAEVLKKYFNGQALESGNSAMTNTLSHQVPEHINTGGQILQGPDGKPMRTLNAPGFGSTVVSQELHQHLQGLEPSAFSGNKTIQAIDKAGGALKEAKLGLGGFHTLTTGLNDLVPEIMQGRFTTLPKAFASMVSGDYRAASLEKNINNGTVDWLSKAGATVGRGPDGLGETLAAKAESLNPIRRFTNGVFNGFINEIKFSLGEFYKGKGVDPTSTEGRQIGAQINNLFGGIDKQVLNRNQTVQQGLRLLSISPDFTEGKIRSAATALNLTRGDKGANLARMSVFGKVIATALLAEVANRLTTGNWDNNLVTFLKQRVLDPQFSLPSQFQKPGSDTPVVAHLPSNILTDINKLVTDPKQFATGRAGSAISLATEALNNKDYYGRQIFNPNDSILQKAENLGQTQLPIFANNIVNAAQGKESWPTAALNTAGLRVTTDPNAPSSVALKAQGQYASTLDAKSAADYAALHPPTTDAAGNPIGSKDILNSALRSDIYLNHPEFLAFDTQNARNAGGQQDPFYTQLTPDQQRLVLASALKIPGQTNNYTKQLYATSWYQPFTQARNGFYASLPASKTPPAVNTPTTDQNGNPLTGSQQGKAYNAAALDALGLPTATTASTYRGSSGGVKGTGAPKGLTVSSSGTKVSSGGKKVKGGKLTTGHIKAPKHAKSLTLKNVAGPKPGALKAPRIAKPRRIKISSPRTSRSLRRGM